MLPTVFDLPRLSETILDLQRLDETQPTSDVLVGGERCCGEGCALCTWSCATCTAD